MALKEKDKGNREQAVSYLLKAMDHAHGIDARSRYGAELAALYKQMKRDAQADSLRQEALQSAYPQVKMAVWHDLYKEALEAGNDKEALKYMQLYADQLELLFTSADRADLLEIERKYDCSALSRQNDEFRRRWTLTLLITLFSVLSLSLLLWVTWKYLRHQKLELLSQYKKDVSGLQQQIDDLQEHIEESKGEADHWQAQMHALEKEKREKEVRIRQLEVIFRSKVISLPAEAIEAAQVYLRIVSKEHPVYCPSEDRACLEHWLNLSRNHWAERLSRCYPSLTNGEKDVCYLHILGLSFEEIAELLGIQLRSVERVVYRVCRKMGMEQGSKEEFMTRMAQIS